MLTSGSLFTGAGGLEMGAQSVLPGRIVAVAAESVAA